MTPSGQNCTMETLPEHVLREHVLRALPGALSPHPAVRVETLARRLAHRQQTNRIYAALEQLREEGKARQVGGWWRRRDVV